MIHCRGIFRYLKRYEPVLFYVVVVLNLIPILSVKYFPTIDGPSHLYNAKLILELLCGEGSWQEYIGFNESFTPNWTGHLLLSLLIKLFSPSIAEKVILGVYLVGVPILVRQLLTQLRAPSLLLVYLVFPFLYSYLFHFGFFNYHLAIGFFFAGLVAWLKALNSKSKLCWVIAGVLPFFVSLGHPFVFGLFVLVVFVLTIGQAMSSNSALPTILFRQLFMLLPGIVITSLFLLNSDSITQAASRIPFRDLLVSFKYIMPIKGLNAELYHLPSKVLLYLFSGLVVVALVSLVVPLVGSRSTRYSWAGVAGLTALLVFVFPDYLGDAGLISSRLMWFFFIFLIIVLALVEFPKIIKSIAFMVALFLTGWSVKHNYTQIIPASDLATEVVDLSGTIESGSTVLTISSFCNAQFTRVGHYSGLQTDVLLLRNYEAELSYFPLVWRYDELPKFRLGQIEPTDRIGWTEGTQSLQQIDYVLVVVEPDCKNKFDCFNSILKNLNQSYNLVKSDRFGSVQLYAKK